MKKVLLLAASILAIGVVALGAVGCSGYFGSSGQEPAAAANVSNQQNSGIWVTGVGKITVTPDIALLNLGVEAQQATVAGAEQEAAQAMDAIMKVLASFNVADKDIKTQYYSIQPVRTYSKDGQEILLGYRVTNTITVKIRKIADTGSIIDAVTAAGGNDVRINSIGFTVDNPDTFGAQAREAAMNDAKAKAKQLAELGGVKLGKPTYISESSYSPPIVYRDATEQASAPTTPISPGELEIQLTVQVVYSIA
jgi:uncharacterized protein YggE